MSAARISTARTNQQPQTQFRRSRDRAWRGRLSVFEEFMLFIRRSRHYTDWEWAAGSNHGMKRRFWLKSKGNRPCRPKVGQRGK
jgi:hypothetical protein